MNKDLYPVRNKNAKPFDFRNILLAVMAIVILFLWIKSCNQKPVPAMPEVKTGEQQTKPVIINEGLSLAKEDSIIELAYFWQRKAVSAEDRYDVLMVDYLVKLQITDSIVNQVVPDTCKEFQAAVNLKIKQLTQSNKDKDNAYNQTVIANQNIVKQKDAIIANGKKDYAFVRAAFDTCTKNSDVILKYAKSVKPKSSIGIGIMAQSAWVQPYKFDAGAMIYFRNKKGTQISAGVLTSQRIQIGYSKQLFKF